MIAWIKDKLLVILFPFGRTDESFKQRRRRDCAGNCFAYDKDKPWPAVHKAKLGDALSLNMRCEAIHDGEIFQNHGVLTMPAGPDLACAGGLRFFSKQSGMKQWQGVTT
jgi:hypothetical protein